MHRGAHAVVIGGSMAGLLVARVLSQHFERVTLVERDRFGDGPEVRKGQPHTRQLHGLLAQGAQIMEAYFPALLDDLQAGGAFVGDMAETMTWYVNGGYRTRFTSGMRAATMSRPFLEWHIRRQVLALPNLIVQDGWSAESLVTDANGVVVGVRGRPASGGDETTLRADLVVDTAGRGSAAGRWLKALGYDTPPEDTLKVDVGYASRLYKRDMSKPESQTWVFITPVAPHERRIGGAFPIEDERWIVSVGGWFGDHCSPDEQAFDAYVRSLPAPDAYNIISTSEPLTEVSTYKYMSSVRRRYERLQRFPEGYLVAGDALCSFNPVYGQGMTSAAMQVRELDRLLSNDFNKHTLAPTFFKRAAKIIDLPWQLAVGEDYRFPEAAGKRPFGTDFINNYVSRVHRASHTDPVVCKAFLDVMNLLKPPASLMNPAIMMRVMRQNQRASAA